MPLYEYKCENCGEVFELMQKFSDQPLTTHEKCGGPVHRMLSAPALQFKGSGWYVNDYAKGGAAPKNGSDGKSDSATPTKTEAGESTSGGKSTESAPAPSSTPSSTSEKSSS